MMGTVSVTWSQDTNTNTNKFFKNNNTRLYSPIKEAAATRDYSPLRETPREYFECLEDSECHDELFLLPEQVLDMDSYVVREDLSAIVPSLRRLSPHNSLDSEDSGSGKSLKLLEDSDGICLARASDDCRTFWLSELITFNTDCILCSKHFEFCAGKCPTVVFNSGTFACKISNIMNKHKRKHILLIG